MTLYDRVASTPDGARALATARLQREALRCLHRAMTNAGVSVEQIAAAIGGRRRDVRRAVSGDGNISIGVLARYLHALGYELDIRLVQAGEPRAAVVEQRDVRAVGYLVTPGDWPAGQPTLSPIEAEQVLDRLDELDDPPPVANARIRAAVEQIRAERTPTPGRDGYTIGVYLPPEATEADIDAITTAVADAVHGHEYQGQWDPFVVGHAGDWLYIDHHPDQVPDYAAHVRARWVPDGDPLGAVDGTPRP